MIFQTYLGLILSTLGSYFYSLTTFSNLVDNSKANFCVIWWIIRKQIIVCFYRSIIFHYETETLAIYTYCFYGNYLQYHIKSLKFFCFFFADFTMSNHTFFYELETLSMSVHYIKY